MSLVEVLHLSIYLRRSVHIGIGMEKNQEREIPGRREEGHPQQAKSLGGRTAWKPGHIYYKESPIVEWLFRKPALGFFFF